MPVQFLSGGGGSISDIRDTFAEPVISNSSNSGVETILVKYTIPANYLLVNDYLQLKILMNNSAGGNILSGLKLRIGTTGTIADPIAFIHDHSLTANYGASTIHFLVINHIKINSIGSSGSCFAVGISEASAGTHHYHHPSTYTPTDTTINTTVPLYISFTMTHTGTNFYIPVGTSLTASF